MAVLNNKRYLRSWSKQST